MSNSLAKDPEFRAGLIGAGYISEYHIRALERLPNVQIRGIVDLDGSKAAAAAQRAGCKPFTSVADLLATGLDVVHVLTPPATHADLAIEALEAGCHVFVEKPLATSKEDADRIVAGAERVGKTVGVSHSELRDPFVRRALDLVRGGAIGKVCSFDYLRSTEFPPYAGGPLPPQYRDGGYLFRDIGVHALYLAEAFLGEIKNVSAEFLNTEHDPNLLFDQWRALIQCAHGSGQVQISTSVRPIQNRFVVQGTEGVLRADLLSLTVTVGKTTRFPTSIERVYNGMNESLQIGTQVPLNVLRVLLKKLRSFHGLQDLVAEFYKNLSQGEPAPITARAAAPIVDWVERSARLADAEKTRYLSRFPTELQAETLVTGATGFVGGALVQRLLAEGQSVRILARRQPSAQLMNDSRVEVVLGDLGDPAAIERAMRGIRLVYHVGAAMSGAPHDYERGTVVGTRNVVESALRHAVARMVYVSSASVLHAAIASPRKGKITEDWPLEPYPERRGLYSKSKLDAERIVTDAVRTRELPAVILRPGRVFGPGEPLMTPSVARELMNRYVILGNGRLLVPLVYIDDLVDALVQAARKEGIEGQVFHLVDPEGLSQNALLKAYQEHTQDSRRAVHVPRFVVSGLAIGIELMAKILSRSPPLSLHQVRSSLAPVTFDCRAARQTLGWQPRVGVRQGLRRTLESDQNQAEQMPCRSEEDQATEESAGHRGDPSVASAPSE